MTDSEPHPGVVGYQLVESLGEGASGVVYKARQNSTGQWVAVKILRANGGAGGAARERRAARFAREMRLCASLHHPHIVRLLDQGKTVDGELFAVFEYVPGETLRELLRREGALPAEQAGELMGQVLGALVEAHAQGIVHRDLKPPNIMVMRRGEQRYAKVLDFGIGTVTTELGSGEYADLTLSSETLGTPRYSAPEQLRGEPPTIKSDLYAWGLILVECLTGAPAVRGQTLAEVYHGHLSPHELPLPPAILHHPLGVLLRRVLSKQARHRGSDTGSIYSRFREIPLHGLVGTLERYGEIGSDDLAETSVSPARMERRQITMLAFSLQLVPKEGMPSEAAMEAMEELLRDQLVLCQDAALAAGGYVAGAMGSTRLVYFGYPQATDSAARLAARTALELVTRCRQRSTRLQAREGVRMTVRVALHTSIMLARPGQVPTGLAVGVVDRLLHAAAPDSIVASDDAERLLQRHCELSPVRLRVMAENGGDTQIWRLNAERGVDGQYDMAVSAARSPLIGREHEVACLAQIWRRAAEGNDAAVMLVGEAGLGKSRLVQSFSELVSAESGQVWILGCMPEQQNSALYPFLRWVMQELGLDDAQDSPGTTKRLQAELARLEVGEAETDAILASWLGLPLPDQLAGVPHSPQRQRSVVVQLLRSLIRALARGPAALIIEDVHWADPTSREFIDSLLNDQRMTGVALVLTSRPESEFQPSIDTLQLKGLTDADAGDLVRNLSGVNGIGVAEIAHLVNRGDGNPLFLTELVRTQLDPRAVATTSRSSSNIPSSLRDVLGQSLDRLGAAKETAQMAAAIGREFDPGLLSRAAMRDHESVLQDLEQLFLADLVLRQRRAQGDTYVFRHALICDAAYDSMTIPARTQVHGRIAHALEQMPGCAPTTLARHFAQAGQYDRAVPLGMDVVSASLGRGLHEEAIGLLDVMQEWIAALPDAERVHFELDMNLLRTQALMSRFGWADPRVRSSAEHSHVLIDRSQSSGSGLEQRFSALWALAMFHHVAGDRRHVRPLTRQLVELAENASVPQPAQRRGAYVLQGKAEWIDGDFSDAALSLRCVVDLPRAQGMEDAIRFGLDCRCWSLAALAVVRWFMDDESDFAMAIARQSIEEAELLGHVPTLGICLLYQSYLFQFEGDRATTREICERLLELSRRYGLPAIEAYGGLVDGWARDDAARMLGIIDGLNAMGCLLGQTQVDAFAAEVLLRGGDADGALKVIDDCLVLADRTGEAYFVPELMRRKASVLSRYGDDSAVKQAHTMLQEAMALASRMGMKRTCRNVQRQLRGMSLSGEQQMPGFHVAPATP